MGYFSTIVKYGVVRFLALANPNYYRIWDYGYNGLPGTYEPAHLACKAAAEMWADYHKFNVDPTGLLSGLQHALDILYTVFQNDTVELFASNLMHFIFPSGMGIKFVDVIDGNKVLHDFTFHENFERAIPIIPVEYVITAGQFKPSAYLAINEKQESDIFVPNSDEWVYWDDTRNVLEFGKNFSPPRFYGEVEAIRDADRLVGFTFIYKLLKATGLLTTLSTFVSNYLRNQKLKGMEERIIEEIDQNESVIVQVYDEVKGIYRGAYR